MCYSCLVSYNAGLQHLDRKRVLQLCHLFGSIQTQMHGTMSTTLAINKTKKFSLAHKACYYLNEPKTDEKELSKPQE